MFGMYNRMQSVIRKIPCTLSYVVHSYSILKAFHVVLCWYVIPRLKSTSNSNQVLMHPLPSTRGERVFLIWINSSTFSEWISLIPFPRRRDSRKRDMREIQSILRESTETGLKVSRGILVWERKLPGFRDLPSVCAFFLAPLSRFFSRTCVSCGNGTFYVRKDNCLRQMLRKNIICNESNFKNNCEKFRKDTREL